MKKVFSEIGFGNDTFISTEIEEGKSEYRVPKLIIPKKVKGFYIRVWIWKKVFILSTSDFFEMTSKDKVRFKLLFGISGVE